MLGLLIFTSVIQLPKKYLNQSVNDINNIDDLNFPITSEDNTATGTFQELTLTKSILIKPYFIIPGNHDRRRSESDCTDFINLLSNDKYVFERDDFLFVSLHQGYRMQMANLYFTPKDLLWFDSSFKSKSDSSEPIKLITYYSLYEGIVNWYEMTDRIINLNTKICVVCPRT